MTVTAIRAKLVNYIADADDKKIKALYTILENDLHQEPYQLTDEQMQLLEESRAEYLRGEGESFDWKTVKENARRAYKNGK